MTWRRSLSTRAKQAFEFIDLLAHLERNGVAPNDLLNGMSHANLEAVINKWADNFRRGKIFAEDTAATLAQRLHEEWRKTHE